MKLKLPVKKYRGLLPLLIFPLMLLFVYSGIYLPSHKKLLSLKNESKEYENTLIQFDITKSDLSEKEIQEALEALAGRLGETEGRLSLLETESINNISRLCHKLNIELASISPGKKEIAQDLKKKSIAVGERNLFRTPIKLNLRTNFAHLMKFVEELPGLPNTVKLEKMTIRKADGLMFESDNLKVDLEISVYNLSRINI